jgi:hypothetical protein
MEQYTQNKKQFHSNTADIAVMIANQQPTSQVLTCAMHSLKEMTSCTQLFQRAVCSLLRVFVCLEFLRLERKSQSEIIAA